MKKPKVQRVRYHPASPILNKRGSGPTPPPKPHTFFSLPHRRAQGTHGRELGHLLSFRTSCIFKDRAFLQKIFSSKKTDVEIFSNRQCLSQQRGGRIGAIQGGGFLHDEHGLETLCVLRGYFSLRTATCVLCTLFSEKSGVTDLVTHPCLIYT